MAKPPGYPKLAEYMSRVPSTAIFHRFQELNILNLLRLQAELYDLERELRQVQQEDASSGDVVREKYVTDFRLMRDYHEDYDSLQHDTLVKIGEKLQEYTLCHFLALAKTETPTGQELIFLQHWLKEPTKGNQFLNDVEAGMWEPSEVEGYVSLAKHLSSQDPFTKFVNGGLLTAYDRVWGRRRKKPNAIHGDGVREYSDKRILAVSDAFSAALSGLLPTIVILVLYFVQRMLVRIGLVIVFTMVFSFALSIFTEANRATNFSATAAFAAVEVVFIGSTTNSTSG